MTNWNDLADETPDIITSPVAPQGMDGVGHFNFSDRERLLSFQWDGYTNQKVTVSHGGYGAPVKWAFDFEEALAFRPRAYRATPRVNMSPLRGYTRYQDRVAALATSDTFRDVAQKFQLACENWILMQEGKSRLSTDSVGGAVKTPIFPSEQDALNVLDKLREMLESYGFVSVDDFYDASGVDHATFADSQLGWHDLYDAHTREDPIGWVLDLPRPETRR